MEPLAEKMSTQNRSRILVELYLLQARVSFAAKENQTAIELIDRAVYLSMHQEYRRIFIDEGKEGVELYKLALAEHELGTVNHYYTGFLKDIIRASRKELKRISSRTSGLALTDMEYQVIAQICKGLSNKQIARLLDVPEDNVKYQLRKVYKKWNINTREAAAKVAQEKMLTVPK